MKRSKTITGDITISSSTSRGKPKVIKETGQGKPRITELTEREVDMVKRHILHGGAIPPHIRALISGYDIKVDPGGKFTMKLRRRV